MVCIVVVDSLLAPEKTLNVHHTNTFLTFTVTTTLSLLATKPATSSRASNLSTTSNIAKKTPTKSNTTSPQATARSPCPPASAASSSTSSARPSPVPAKKTNSSNATASLVWASFSPLSYPLRLPVWRVGGSGRDMAHSLGRFV